MLHEIALDPAVICDKASARYFFDACKAEKGRLIAQFPSKWKKRVFQHCRSALPDGLSLKYIEERLHKMDCSLVRTGRDYDSEKDWIFNAVMSNKINPFKAIVSTCAGPDVCKADEVDDELPAWKVETSITVELRPGPFSSACSGLMKMAGEVVLVDPFFSGTSAQMSILNSLLAEATQGVPLKSLEYHVKARVSSDEYKQRLVKDIIPNLITLPVPFWIIRWENASETLHDRYILTDRAGVNVAQGLSECRQKEEDTTDLALLGQAAFECRRSQYSAKNDGHFKFIDGWCINGEEVLAVRREFGQWTAGD